MKNIRTQFLSGFSKLFHRFWLWTKPAYRRHRTRSQKNFDLKIQYTFLGCLLGIIAVGVVVFLKAPSVVIVPEEIFEADTFVPEEAPQTLETADEITPMIALTTQPVTTTTLNLKKRETL